LLELLRIVGRLTEEKEKVFVKIEIRYKVEMMWNLRVMNRAVADKLRCMHKPVLLRGS